MAPRHLFAAVVVGGAVAVAPGNAGDTVDGSIFALEAKTGTTVWEQHAPMAAPGKPAVAGGHVFVKGGDDCNLDDSKVASLDAAAGAVLWTSAAADGGCNSGTPAVGDAIVVVRTSVDELRGLDAASGKQRWSAPVRGNVTHTAHLVLVANGRTLRALDRRTGKQRWLARPPSAREFAVGVDGVTASSAITTDFPGLAVRLTSTSLATGKRQWSRAVAASGEGVMTRVGGGVVVVCSYGSNEAMQLAGADVRTGRVIWRRVGARGFAGEAAIADGRYYVSASDGQRAVLDARSLRNGKRAWSRPWARVAAAGDGELVLDQGSGIVALAATDGHELWRRTFSGASDVTQGAFAGGRLYLARWGSPIPAPGG
jgi:outer membrane protein assembly factor BamB